MKVIPIVSSQPSSPIASQTGVSRAGDWLRRHGSLLRGLQWATVLIYAFLILVPVFLPLPDQTAHLWSNLTLIAEFAFWGIWWPFVLISMILVGRTWCGVLCPEGALSEFASRHGRGKSIPRWMRWKGWPFAAFVMTTVYGQMVSVYQYPKAVLVVLGGSTLGAIIVGYLYGKEKRVWCKYLCPVNGVFGLLAKLSPLHFKVSEDAWRASYDTHGKKTEAVNCAPLVPMRAMIGASDCHMCGRCSGHRNAVALATRMPSEEIVKHGKTHANGWETVLILYGLMGVAIGAFHWTVSPWFIAVKQALATWLIDQNVMWPFDTSTPWWLFTNYPDQNDVFSWLDGSMVIAYIMATALVLGTGLALLVMLANRMLGKWDSQRFHHLAQALIPVAGSGVFLGLTATTVTLLKHEFIDTSWVGSTRLAMLTGANVWTIWLAWKVSGRYQAGGLRRLAAVLAMAGALALIDYAWYLMFWHW